MNEITSLSATRMAQLIRSREVSSEELVQAHLRQIEAVNSGINAVVHLSGERALREARQRDAELKKAEVRGPLHGVPMTVKDSLETEGIVTTSGTLGRANHIPERDASTVALMRAAGAVVIGKTNVPELCLAFESDNLVYGRTNNPYDVTKTSGGSSGGEAAIIAAAGSPIGLGSDAGGSVRLPAHFCGIAGIKPTSGRLPKTGHFLPPGGLADRLWQIGPMSRFVEDLILVMPILAQADGLDASFVPMPLRNPASVRLNSLRIAFYTNNGISDPTTETKETVTQAAKALLEMGAPVEEAQPDGIGTASQLWCEILGADGGSGLRSLLETIGTTRFHPLLQRFLDISGNCAMSTDALLGLVVRWDDLRTRMLRFLSKYDAIICPVAASPAIPHATSYDRLDIFTYTMAYNFTGWPGAVVRCGTSPEGLPINVQIVAQPWREDVALAVAKHLEEVFGGWKPVNNVERASG
jgi:amidase